MGKKSKKKKRQVSGLEKKPAAINLDSADNQVEQPVEDGISSSVADRAAEEEPAARAREETAGPVPEKKGEKTREPPVVFSIQEKINRNITVRSRLRRMLPDLVRVLLALSVIGIGAAIWWKPPLMSASFPITTFKYKDQPIQEAALFRPLAMQERYYVKLPAKLENRYEWFAIDRRREVVALTEEPGHSFLGKPAIKRGDDLGLDLEFRNIDGHEWLIYFYQEAIVFSNNLLTVRLDTEQPQD